MLERLIASQNMAAVRLDSDLPTLVDLLPKQAKVAAAGAPGGRAARRAAAATSWSSSIPATWPPRTSSTQTRSPHALRELNELEAFTYVPPFRGRAIRMIRRDVPFDELDIDFAALEARKAAEYEKLNRVIRFALSGACRQREILRYFGEEEPRRCGHCDNCRRRHAAARPRRRQAGRRPCRPARRSTRR